MRQRGFRNTAHLAYQVPAYPVPMTASVPECPCSGCHGRGCNSHPTRRIIRDEELPGACGGPAIAAGLVHLGELAPCQSTTRCVIYSLAAIDRALEGLESGRIKLWHVLLASRLGRQPNPGEIQQEERRQKQIAAKRRRHRSTGGGRTPGPRGRTE